MITSVSFELLLFLTGIVSFENELKKLSSHTHTRFLLSYPASTSHPESASSSSKLNLSKSESDI